MLTIISPAKTLDYESALITNKFSQPQQLDQSKILIKRSRQLTVKQLEELMKISPALATLNHQRFAKWQTPFTPENARQAILAFKGDVYEGLHVEDFSNPDFDFAQDNLRILSGLYGLLRPLDLIEPYRLEMGIRLDNPRGKNLYEFWGDLINASLHEQLSEHTDAVLINLASDEYFKAVNRKKLNFPIIKPIFLDEKRGEFKTISFYAKKARGLMSRFIIKNQITSPKVLPEFNLAGYQFNKSQSTETELVFKRTEKEAQLQQR